MLMVVTGGLREISSPTQATTRIFAETLQSRQPWSFIVRTAHLSTMYCHKRTAAPTARPGSALKCPVPVKVRFGCWIEARPSCLSFPGSHLPQAACSRLARGTSRCVAGWWRCVRIDCTAAAARLPLHPTLTPHADARWRCAPNWQTAGGSSLKRCGEQAATRPSAPTIYTER